MCPPGRKKKGGGTQGSQVSKDIAIMIAIAIAIYPSHILKPYTYNYNL